MTRTELKAQLANRCGPDVTTWATQYNAAIYRAIKEICTVKWKFLLRNASITVTASETSYSLATRFNQIHKVYIGNYATGTTTQLIEGTMEDIVLNPLSSAGEPRYYDCADYSSSENISIGYPTSDGTYYIEYSYYEVLPDIGDSETSAISAIYRDEPILDWAEYYILLDMEDPRSQIAQQKAIAAMATMEAEMPYDGDSYSTRVAREVTP